MQLLQFEDIVQCVLSFEKGSGGGVDSKQLERCFFFSAISFCSARVQHSATSSDSNMIYLAFADDHQN